ncbi:MAG: PAS domain-containing protein, partial [Bdellovibrionales bacterium]|nr:PAS domain-containing protein [Bdellovibrionales bacterium]
EIVFMNRSAEILTGWRGAEAIGQKLSDVLAVKFRNEDGTTLDRIEEIYPNHLTLARVKNALLKNKDSGFFGIDYTVTPICDSESECLGVVVVARDAASKGSGYARNIE